MAGYGWAGQLPAKRPPRRPSHLGERSWAGGPAQPGCNAGSTQTYAIQYRRPFGLSMSVPKLLGPLFLHPHSGILTGYPLTPKERRRLLLDPWTSLTTSP